MNDVKVLVEICLRELTNILRNSGDARLDDLRLRYASKSEMIFKFCCFDRLFLCPVVSAICKFYTVFWNARTGRSSPMPSGKLAMIVARMSSSR